MRYPDARPVFVAQDGFVSGIIDNMNGKNRLADLLEACARLHHHLCPRQVLGVRMGLLAGQLLSLDLPREDKRLFVFVETDGCGADGVSVATGCWVGRRTLRVMDFGKMAATFVDRETGAAFRIHPHPGARTACARYAPSARSRWHAYLDAYQVMPDAELLAARSVRLSVSLADIVSHPDAQALCAACGEEIMNDRQVERDGRTLCRACAGEVYYSWDS